MIACYVIRRVDVKILSRRSIVSIGQTIAAPPASQAVVCGFFQSRKTPGDCSEDCSCCLFLLRVGILLLAISIYERLIFDQTPTTSAIAHTYPPSIRHCPVSIIFCIAEHPEYLDLGVAELYWTGLAARRQQHNRLYFHTNRSLTSKEAKDPVSHGIPSPAHGHCNS